MEYGTGAVMSVPAHDERDHAFAVKYHLPIMPVIQPQDKSHWDYQQAAFIDYGILFNSGNYTGLTSLAAIEKISEELAKLGAEKQIHYRLKRLGRFTTTLLGRTDSNDSLCKMW